MKISQLNQQELENLLAEEIFETLPDSEKTKLGTEDIFGEKLTKLDIARALVAAAVRNNEPLKYGYLARHVIAHHVESPSLGFTVDCK